MTKLYVVMEVSFEYNDEVSRRPECGGGKPLTFYKTMQQASLACALKNIAYLKGLAKDQYGGLSNYGYAIDEIFRSPDTVREIIGDAASDLDDDQLLRYNWSLLSDEKLIKVCDELCTPFYEVAEVVSG
jgi:hypothetical protein